MVVINVGYFTPFNKFALDKLNNVDLKKTVGALKNSLIGELNRPQNEYAVMFAGSLLNNDDAALCDVGIHENDVVYLIEMKADKPSAVPDFPDKDIKHLMNVCYILQDKNIMKTVLQKLNDSEVMNAILAMNPILEGNVVAMTIFREPKLLSKMGETMEACTRIAKDQPALAFAVRSLATLIPGDILMNDRLTTSALSRNRGLDSVKNGEGMNSQPDKPSSGNNGPQSSSESVAPPAMVSDASAGVDVAAPAAGVDVAAPVAATGVAAPAAGMNVAAPVAEMDVAAPTAEVNVAAPVVAEMDVGAPTAEVDVAAPIEMDVAAPTAEADIAAPIEMDVTAQVGLDVATSASHVAAPIEMDVATQAGIEVAASSGYVTPINPEAPSTSRFSHEITSNMLTQAAEQVIHCAREIPTTSTAMIADDEIFILQNASMVQLKCLGFLDDVINLQALRISDGNVEQAINILLSGVLEN